MRSSPLRPSAVLFALFSLFTIAQPLNASAQAQERGFEWSPPSFAGAIREAPGNSLRANGTAFFLEGEAGAAIRKANSKTTTGGAIWSGGGQVTSVQSAATSVTGVRAGVTLGGLQLFASYRHLDGGVNWSTDFPRFGQVNLRTAARATSDVLLANVAYVFAVDRKTVIRLSAGAGVSLNKLEGISEGDTIAVIDAAQNTAFSGRLAAGLDYKLVGNWRLGLEAGLDYYGKFRTADTRTASSVGSPEPIGRYEFTSWGGTVSARIGTMF